MAIDVPGRAKEQCDAGGVAVVLVERSNHEERPTVAVTVGLYENHRSPELLMLVDESMPDAAFRLHELAKQVYAERPRFTRMMPPLRSLDRWFLFEPLTPDDAAWVRSLPPLMRVYPDGPVALMQVIQSDAMGRFPWHPQSEPDRRTRLAQLQGGTRWVN